MEALSDRELAVFRLIGEGRGTREIADDLHVSVKTVRVLPGAHQGEAVVENGRELAPARDPLVTRDDGT